uniref:Uncharacterized protein n=1 Tax=Anguilla anguilla TaxID=7936 RepID=A0A0E9XJF6_ANGAN
MNVGQFLNVHLPFLQTVLFKMNVSFNFCTISPVL